VVKSESAGDAAGLLHSVYGIRGSTGSQQLQPAAEEAAAAEMEHLGRSVCRAEECTVVRQLHCLSVRPPSPSRRVAGTRPLQNGR